MSRFLLIFVLLINSYIYGQIDVDLTFDYKDFLHGDSSRNYRSITIFVKKFGSNKQSDFELSEKLFFNEEGNLFERHYFCGTNYPCDTMRFIVNGCGKSILDYNSFKTMTLPSVSIELNWKNICIEYDENNRICSVVINEPEYYNEMKFEYYYDEEGRLIEFFRYFEGKLEIIKRIKYNT